MNNNDYFHFLFTDLNEKKQHINRNNRCKTMSGFRRSHTTFSLCYVFFYFKPNKPMIKKIHIKIKKDEEMLKFVFFTTTEIY